MRSALITEEEEEQVNFEIHDHVVLVLSGVAAVGLPGWATRPLGGPKWPFSAIL